MPRINGGRRVRIGIGLIAAVMFGAIGQDIADAAVDDGSRRISEETADSIGAAVTACPALGADLAVAVAEDGISNDEARDLDHRAIALAARGDATMPCRYEPIV